MSYLLFMDESGHDHTKAPYEVRGGIALHASQVWAFVRAMQSAEVASFGAHLHDFGKEIKGRKILNKATLQYGNAYNTLDGKTRRTHALACLQKGRRGEQLRRVELAAYGQACLTFARELFRLMASHKAVVFAAAMPRGTPSQRPDGGPTDYLRKDHVFLLERYFYFLELKREHGLLVMDESGKALDRDFLQRLEKYYTHTITGQHRTAWIVPSPFFVSSAMAYPIQAADVCIYCVNWGFRSQRMGMDADARKEIAEEFGPWLDRLQFKGHGYNMVGDVYRSWGIVCVPDPYTTR